MKLIATAAFVAMLVATTYQSPKSFQKRILPPILPTEKPECPTDCKLAVPDRLNRRIINGQPADQKDSTSVVAILSEPKYNETGSAYSALRCTATILTCNKILTAAHCIKPCLDVYPITNCTGINVELLVFVGYNLNSATTDQIYEVEKVDIHPLWNPEFPIRSDLAIITLTRPILLSESARPVLLVPSNFELGYGEVTAKGFGLTEENKISPMLRQVDLSGVPYLKCLSKYPLLNWPLVLLGVQCLEDATKSGKATCNGDSGGPAMVNCTEGYKAQEGITIFHLGPTCSNSDYPSGYTKVSTYVDWIKQETQNQACVADTCTLT